MVADNFRIPLVEKKNRQTARSAETGVTEVAGVKIASLQVAKKSSYSQEFVERSVFFPLLGVKTPEQREGVRVSAVGESGRKSRAEKRALLQQQKECGVTPRPCPVNLGFAVCAKKSKSTRPPVTVG